MNHKCEIQQEIKEQSRTANGCFALFAFVFTMLITGSLVLLVTKEYKNNKKHKNVISCMYDKEKKIVISDVDTHIERTINYAGYKLKKLPTDSITDFETQIKHSKTGDTVLFVAPKYSKQTTFEMNDQNRLYLNQDSIIARIKVTKQR